MADNLAKRPKKGILKNSSSFETKERQKELTKAAKWDEMNIIATHHPKDKDYGHMKIEEPKTPYAYESCSGDELDGVDANLLADKIAEGGHDIPKALEEKSEEESSDDDDANLTEEEKQTKKLFESKRKHHYNEFYAVKLARKLMEKDEEETAEGTDCGASTSDTVNN